MAQASAPSAASEFPLFVKVQLGEHVKTSSLKPGDAVDGNLVRDVYDSESKVYAAGSPIQLTVDRIDRKHKTPSDRWPWAVRLFLPHHENSPVFKDISISMPDGTHNLLQASLLSSNRMKEVRSPLPSGKKSDPASVHHPSRGSVLYLETHLNGDRALKGSNFSPPSSGILPAGTACRVLLLTGISASRNHPGDPIQARLLEPVLSDSRVIFPAGSLFEGHVLKSTAPRMMSRAGSLTLSFDSVSLPEGNRIPASASIASLDISSGSPVKLDREGRLRGSRPGLGWRLLNGGVSAGMDKVIDDSTQLVIEAIVSTATDASTAGAARIVGTAVSGIFLLTSKGHDVVLPSHTEMNITLNRPFALLPQVASAASQTASIPQHPSQH